MNPFAFKGRTAEHELATTGTTEALLAVRAGPLASYLCAPTVRILANFSCITVGHLSHLMLVLEDVP